ncbi:MAG: DegT/DnrJ/EryC1/StrS family aminotransferase [Dinoroseobacter sp.]|nr:DegT/DnrJ/EryC1/StrS family aminotransferase [Dinoroseobacter sp.]
MPDFQQVQDLLRSCAQENQWANRGPVYHAFRDAATRHANVGSDAVAVPVANAGLALEGMARLLEQDEGRPLRWLVSSFSFRNLGRGYFASSTVLDCTENGMLDLALVAALEPDDWDGMIVVNPFGSGAPNLFETYIEWALSTGKHVLLDNAAGFARTLPNWPWQSISLHQTKPYGAGEGGLAIVPADREEDLYALFDYGTVPDPASAWLNNSKISDISCAFLLDRLKRVDNWAPNYLEQAHRIDNLALQSGLVPLLPLTGDTPCMSRAYLAERPIELQELLKAKNLTFGKYYQPLQATPVASTLFSRLLNIPTHPDMSSLTDDEILTDLAGVIS